MLTLGSATANVGNRPVRTFRVDNDRLYPIGVNLTVVNSTGFYVQSNSLWLMVSPPQWLVLEQPISSALSLLSDADFAQQFTVVVPHSTGLHGHPSSLPIPSSSINPPSTGGQSSLGSS